MNKCNRMVQGVNNEAESLCSRMVQGVNNELEPLSGEISVVEWYRV